MKNKVKVISVATNSTKNQLEDAINTQLTKGWKYKSMILAGSNWFIVLEKSISE